MIHGIGKKGWLSICCGAHPDSNFHFDEEVRLGICWACKDHSEFEMPCPECGGAWDYEHNRCTDQCGEGREE